MSVTVVVSMKITRSQDLGIGTCCKHKSVDICETLVSVRFELLNMAHKRYKSCIFGSACLWFTDCTHSDPCFLLMHTITTQVKVICRLCDTASRYCYSSTWSARTGMMSNPTNPGILEIKKNCISVKMKGRYRTSSKNSA